MRTPTIPRRTAVMILGLGLGLGGGARADHPSFDQMGYDALLARLGFAGTPTGENVVVATVEVGAEGDYGPPQDDLQFVGKDFIPMSGDPGSGNLHGLLVGRFQYGVNWSIARDVDEIYLYTTSDWLLGGYLRAGFPSTQPPLPTPGDIKLVNNSWIAGLGTPAGNNDAMRRLDLAIARDDLIITNGMPNGDDEPIPLLWHSYNALAVGVQTGIHYESDTVVGLDGPGRMKPDLVAPHDEFTSYATPMANAVGALLVETARTWPTLSGNARAERSEVLKAAMLAGAAHIDAHDGVWSNGAVPVGPNRGRSDRPLDDVVGAGTINVDRSHRILTGGEQAAATAPPVVANAARVGWDLAAVPREDSVFYRFHVTGPVDEVSIAATWHRAVRLASGTWSVAQIDLELFRVGPTGNLVPLVGEAGEPHFGGGNVVSESVVDNVEHLYLTDLGHGDYVLEVARIDSLSTQMTWDVAVAWIFPEVMTPVLPEDIDGNGTVAFDDLLLLLVAWGDCPAVGACPEDVDGDGEAGFEDLLRVLAAWGYTSG